MVENLVTGGMLGEIHGGFISSAAIGVNLRGVFSLSVDIDLCEFHNAVVASGMRNVGDVASWLAPTLYEPDRELPMVSVPHVKLRGRRVC